MAYLPEAAIQKLESLDIETLKALLKDGSPKHATTLKSLLVSYRMAANVANTTWALVKELQTGHPIRPETWQAVTQAFHRYSPGNFPPAHVDAAFARQLLESIYNRAADQNREAILSILCEELERLPS